MKRFYVIGIILIIVLSLPIVLWYAANEHSLNVAIIDKTVPNETYREHAGLTWLLNYMKITNAHHESYQRESDYYGFKLNEQERSYDIRALPTDYSDYDVIYLADTYGVYEDDLAWIEKARDGSRSEIIYGGLSESEWHAIHKRLMQKEKSLLIAEFNTFASPTNGNVRSQVAEVLGVDWSGWIGRYFSELDPDKNQEIPQWIIDDFKDTWTYSGAGFILVNDINYDVIVLESGEHVQSNGIRVTFTDEGKALFTGAKDMEYGYWFDIITPTTETTVLANYDWVLTESGKELLQQHGIPAQFAAVLTKEKGAATSYYFAGDYNDVAHVPRFYQIVGLPNVYKITQKYSDDVFYWSTYFPMMKSILTTFMNELDVTANSAQHDGHALQYNTRVYEDSFEIYRDNQWEPITIKGVNIGMGKPGHFPGEAAITEEEYYRWFEMIGEMNANTIRVYTLHPPGFYHALKRYNETHEQPIYVFHGVWINEERLEETLDAYDPHVLHDFQNEMMTIVDVIHGNRIVPENPGHASGVYSADISEYVIGWILGIEWYPYMVEHTNEKYSTIGDYDGTYFHTKNAQAFEYWLAEQMDFITTYEVEHYQWIRPMSFTNWVTTDILEHPAEPNEGEDMVSVDPNVIYTKNEMQLTEQFASYHIYPYYPDFFNYEQSYQTYVDHRGEYNSYAAYLEELHAVHRLPILVAEFGVPGSRGLTHVNPFGWNQGFLSEREQGEIIQRLYEDIQAEQLLGGLVFTWQDEWFKRTWNTMDYDDPDRRPFWSNAQTNEQQFGLLSFDRHKIRVDGMTDDWSSNAVLYEQQDGELKALYVDHDERYLYLRLDYEVGSNGTPLFLLDVVPELGNTFIEGRESITFQDGVDFILQMDGEQSRILIDPYYDFFNYLYAHHLQMLEPLQSTPTKNSGKFVPILYALNKELYLPQQDILLPFSSYETGRLREGNGNPDAVEYDSLADYTINENGTLEIRIPWLLIQARDPSQKQFIGDLYANGLSASSFVDQIQIGVLFYDKQGVLLDAFPNVEGNQLGALKGYTWDNWEEPLYQERLKQSYYIVKELFKNY